MTPQFQQFTRELPRHLYALGVGVVAGGVVGTVGWGGAQVILPSLSANHALAGYTQLSATGVSLTSLSTSTLTSGYKFWNAGHVDLPIAMMVGIPAVLSARVGTQFAKKLSGDALALIFNACSIVLIPTHFWIQERAKKRRKLQQQERQQDEEGAAVQKKALGNDAATAATAQAMQPTISYYSVLEDPQKVVQFASFGLFQGVLSSLMGVGGLPLSMSYLTEMTTLDHHCVQGTAVCAVIPSIMTSALSRLHAIPIATAWAVCCGAIMGGYGGAKLAISLDDEQLHFLYMCSLVLFGGRSMVGATTNMRRLLLQRAASKKK